jgi:hypothetical protein
MTTKPTATDKPADVMPEIDADDGIDHNAGAGVVDQGSGDEGQQPEQRHEIRTEGAFDDARTAAVKAYRAKRDAEAAAAKGQNIPGRHMQVGQVLTGQEGPNGQEVEHGRLIPEGEEPPADEPVDDQGQQAADDEGQRQPAPAAKTPAAPAQFGDDTEIPLVIDGRVVTKKLSEIVRHAQRDLSTDNRLEEANRLLREARATSAAPGTPGDQGEGANGGDRRPASQARQPEQQPDDEPIDVETARALARKIQVGDEEEGAQAIAELIQTVAKRANAQQPGVDQIRQATRQELQHQENRREITTALEKFSTTYPTIVADADLTEVAMNRVKAELRADLKAAGLDDESLNAIKDDTNALTNAHRSLRQQGARVRDYVTLLDNVGSYLQNKFGQAPAQQQQRQQNPSLRPGQPSQQPDPRLQQRQDMKRQAPLQPRAAGVRGTNQPMQAKPKSKADIVAEMRRNRGFTH